MSGFVFPKSRGVMYFFVLSCGLIFLHGFLMLQMGATIRSVCGRMKGASISLFRPDLPGWLENIQRARMGFVREPLELERKATMVHGKHQAIHVYLTCNGNEAVTNTENGSLTKTVRYLLLTASDKAADAS